jgi:ribosomal protein S18 acetylase RimI-like enzyme
MTPEGTSAAVVYTLHDELPAEAALIGAGLDHANFAAAPLHEVGPLACLARNTAGQMVGGAVGRTWGGCGELQQLWVDPAWRRRGIGAALVRAFEARAEQRGVRTVYLDTFSFQAPGLYRSLGYRVGLELRGFAPGISKFTMLRELDGAPSRS